MSLAALHLEGLGIPTLSLGSGFDIMRAGRAPRGVFVDYPLGHSAGKPFDREDQYRIVRAAVDAFGAIAAAGTIRGLEARWDADPAWKASAMSAQGGDTRMPRDTSPQYQTEDDRRLAEG